VTSARVDSLELVRLPTMRDARGTLTVAEFNTFVPFAVMRLFYVRDVPPEMARGQHAHYRCNQYMMCIGGRLRITTTDGARERSFELSPGHALHVPPGIFATETYLDSDTVLLVLCDRPYEKDDYIHTMEAFLDYRRGSPK
jgi:UDP-2-acetamido-3-amino-2,3-dideoxy-glucuronate N-acetyltransferase